MALLKTIFIFSMNCDQQINVCTTQSSADYANLRFWALFSYFALSV